MEIYNAVAGHETQISSLPYYVRRIASKPARHRFRRQFWKECKRQQGGLQLRWRRLKEFFGEVAVNCRRYGSWRR
jgi:hypothetical protein